MTMPSEVELSEGNPSERPMYRRYSLEYKRRMVAEYDALPSGGGQKGSMLRRENLARRQLSEWRRLDDPAPDDASKRRSKRTPEQIEMAQLRESNARLQAELHRTRLALEITGKARELLELFSESAACGNTPL